MSDGMQSDGGESTLSSDAWRTLCRLARGVPVPAHEEAIADLADRGLVERVSAAEHRDAKRWTALAEERARLRDELQRTRRPGGIRALVPGAAARFRAETAKAQSQLDAGDAESREIERRYSGRQRERWERLLLAAGSPGGGCALVTTEGYRDAFAHWAGGNTVPAAEVCAAVLAEAGERTAEYARALAAWQSMPPERLWLTAALLGSEPAGTAAQAIETLRGLHQWLGRQEFWWEDPFPVAVILAGARNAGQAARAAVETFEALRGRGLEAGPETLTAACRLEARSSWLPSAVRLRLLESLLRRADDLGLVGRLREVAPLACLPRPPAETGQALGEIRGALRRRHPGGRATLEVASVLLAGAGFHHSSRQDDRSLFSGDDPVAESLAERYEALAFPTYEVDGPTSGPADRVEVLAAAAAWLPGPAEGVVRLLRQAREALGAAGAPEGACRAPTTIALASQCGGTALGLDPRELAWELLRADEIAQAAWKSPQTPGREAAPVFRSY